MLLYALMLQQGQTPTPGPLDGLITPAALLMLILGALAPFANRIAAALLKVIESGAGLVEQFLRERRVNTDTIETLIAQNRAIYERETEQAKRADRAVDVSLKATDAATESNKAVLKLTDEAIAAAKKIADLEKELAEMRAARLVAETRLAAATAWNKPAGALGSA